MKKSLSPAARNARRQESKKFVGKRVLAGGREGMGDRVDEKTGCLIVAFGRFEQTFNPEVVQRAG